MPNLEWEVPHGLQGPFDDFGLNEIDVGNGRMYQIQPDGYKIIPTPRVSQDNISQQPGSVLHDGYPSGLVATLKVLYAVYPTLEAPNYEPACATDLREMHQLLTNILYSMWGTPGDPNVQMLSWNPTTASPSTRALLACQTLAWTDPNWENIGWTVTFSLTSPYPYAIDLAEIDTTLSDGVSVLVPNDGSAPVYPVVEVDGATSSFSITNTDSGETVLYSGTTIGGGEHAEINFFDGTCYLNGSSTDLGASIDPTATDFFTIKPGGTNILLTGASGLMKSWHAYC